MVDKNKELKDELKDELNNKSKDESKEQNDSEETSDVNTEDKVEEKQDDVYNELEERKKELKSRLKYGMKKGPKDSNRKGKEENDKNTSPKNKFNFKAIIMLVFVVTMFMSIPSMLQNKEKMTGNEVKYTEFVQKIKSGDIKSIKERDGYIYGQISETEAIKARMLSDRIAEDTNLMGILMERNVEIRSIKPEGVPILVSILVSWFPILLLVGILFFMLNKMNKGGGGGPQIFNMGKSKAKENGEEVSDVCFDDVAGIEEAKYELEEVVDFLKEPEKYKKLGAKLPKGVLLLGAPGTGKTLLARAVAGEAQVPFFSISGSEFVEMFVGVGASRVRDLFSKARKNSPCIVFIDEIDAVGRKRGSGQGGGNDEREQTLNQLLVEMDGFTNEETIIVIAATNRPEILDSALMRPGRFDRQVIVDRPDMKGREQILEVHIKGKKMAKDIDLQVLARKTPGFVGADLANMLNEAAILAASLGKAEIDMEDLEEAAEKVSIGPERKSRVTIEKERITVAYHEVGHAIIQWLLPNLDPVHKVTIVPRGMAALGYTMSLPTEEKHLKSKKEYLSEIKALLGGRGAEEIIFGDITTGASNDIERATKIAHAMVTKFGMSDNFGPILLDNTTEEDMFPKRLYSETTGKEIDDEIRKMITDAYAETLKLLRDNHDKLEIVSKTLLDRETITGKELNTLLTGGTLEPMGEKRKTPLEVRNIKRAKEKEEQLATEKLEKEKAEKEKKEKEAEEKEAAEKIESDKTSEEENQEEKTSEKTSEPEDVK